MTLREEQRFTQPRISQLPDWRPGKSSRVALHKTGGLADQWCRDDGDIMCHPTLVLPSLQGFDVANA